MKDLDINEQIRDEKVRLVGDDGEQVGVVDIDQALDLAERAGLDLVKVAPNAKPPVCRIMDYGKYRYEMQKKDKEARKNQRIIKVREMKMTPNIEPHDMSVKAEKTREFLKDGDRVKVSVKFRGRQMGHTEIGKVVLDDFLAILGDEAKVDKPPKLEGRSMVMYIVAANE
ncbi:MAG: translation initiation factor IF-3 [Firmicutes bacterium]|nr:translation initiation factor IF-3 [Ezakiella sp.]MDD7762098.1 translation initiation factor IF-3 [Bacillota bacterium]